MGQQIHADRPPGARLDTPQQGRQEGYAVNLRARRPSVPTCAPESTGRPEPTEAAIPVSGGRGGVSTATSHPWKPAPTPSARPSAPAGTRTPTRQARTASRTSPARPAAEHFFTGKDSMTFMGRTVARFLQNEQVPQNHADPGLEANGTDSGRSWRAVMNSARSLSVLRDQAWRGHQRGRSWWAAAFGIEVADTDVADLAAVAERNGHTERPFSPAASHPHLTTARKPAGHLPRFRIAPVPHPIAPPRSATLFTSAVRSRWMSARETVASTRHTTTDQRACMPRLKIHSLGFRQGLPQAPAFAGLVRKSLAAGRSGCAHRGQNALRVIWERPTHLRRPGPVTSSATGTEATGTTASPENRAAPSLSAQRPTSQTDSCSASRMGDASQASRHRLTSVNRLILIGFIRLQLSGRHPHRF